MISILGSRLRQFVPTLVFVSLVAFLLRVIIPGGPAAALAGGGGQEAIDRINEQHGLDRPLYEQYLSWIGTFLRGDLGTSFKTGLPVSEMIGPRLASTIELVVISFVLVVVVGGGLGLLAAIKRDQAVGRFIFAASGLGVSIPVFWLATVTAGVFGVVLAVLPANGYTPPSEGLGPHVQSILMPVLIMSVPPSALMLRQVRSAMVLALESSYIRTAWAMGVSARRIYFDLALRNAAPPVLSLVPFIVALLVGELVVIDTVFVLPGLGAAIIDSINYRDFATLQTIVLMLAVAVLILSMLADLAAAALDPRRRKAVT